MPIMAGAFAVTYPAWMDYSFLPAYAVFSSIALAVALAYLSLCSLAMLTSRVVQHFRP